MDTILHVLDVPANPAAVFAALSTEAGLAAWWTTKVRADTTVGEIEFSFAPLDFNPRMRIVALDPPTTVSWTCVGGAEGWQDAGITFELRGHDGGTRLTFRQGYGEPLDDEAFGIFNFNWGHYLGSLRGYCESGTGQPFPAR